jgi:Skp family chaperone for outer membrane proteins
MTHTKFAFSALLGLAIAASPALADTADDLKEAIKKLDKATKELQDAKDALKVDELRGKAITIDTKVDLIDKDIQEIKKDIRDIKRKLNDSSSTSLRPDTESAIARGQARVRFINEFSEEMSVVINGRSYRLLPGQEKLVTVLPGEFTYQVLQLQRFPQERRISSEETKTIRIYPLP